MPLSLMFVPDYRVVGISDNCRSFKISMSALEVEAVNQPSSWSRPESCLQTCLNIGSHCPQEMARIPICRSYVFTHKLLKLLLP